VIVGFEAYLAGMRAVMDAFSSFRIRAEGFIPVTGAVLALTKLDGETIENLRRFSGEGGAIFELTDGLIDRVWEFDDRAELFRAAGITAEQAHRRTVSPDRARELSPKPT